MEVAQLTHGGDRRLCQWQHMETGGTSLGIAVGGGGGGVSLSMGGVDIWRGSANPASEEHVEVSLWRHNMWKG